jgi:hypothetical protein
MPTDSDFRSDGMLSFIHPPVNSPIQSGEPVFIPLFSEPRFLEEGTRRPISFTTPLMYRIAPVLQRTHKTGWLQPALKTSDSSDVRPPKKSVWEHLLEED